VRFNAWRAVKENCCATYCTDWPCSRYKWCQINDVIFAFQNMS